jgi:hypothetical protein
MDAQDETEVKKKATTKDEALFADRLKRLKESLGVKTDSQLAHALGKTQQAIAGSKKRRIIPTDWIRKLAEQEISFDLIFYGRQILKEDAGGLKQELCQEESDKCIANSLVTTTLKDSGLSLSPDQIPPMETYVKKYILPEAKEKIADFINDFSKKANVKE